ncbi:hypothetical protein Hypma_007889 [Hypsizygus marmoreus]|uniref:Uncharacterized protein n=1 Tax=Hypsizygus marmoreus TaxID=39966 RepID=A0A369JU80_HYPMA|nr:hypothetical protein Hypma_007889 [Hypsizygus marmoreus]
MSNLPLFRDPWAKREAWRKHPVFSNRIMFRNLFPGFEATAEPSLEFNRVRAGGCSLFLPIENFILVLRLSHEPALFLRFPCVRQAWTYIHSTQPISGCMNERRAVPM